MSSLGVRFGGCLVFCLYILQLRIVAQAFLITWAPLLISHLYYVGYRGGEHFRDWREVGFFLKDAASWSRICSKDSAEVPTLKYFELAIHIFARGCDTLRRIPYGSAIDDSGKGPYIGVDRVYFGYPRPPT